MFQNLSEFFMILHVYRGCAYTSFRSPFFDVRVNCFASAAEILQEWQGFCFHLFPVCGPNLLRNDHEPGFDSD